VPDRTGELLAAMTGAGSGWRLDVIRALLIGLAAVEVFGGTVALLGGGGDGIPVHLVRELGGFSLALGVGLLLAALRPWRIAALLPVVATLAVTSVMAGVVDMVGGRADVAGEAHHLLEVAAVLALWRLTCPARRIFATRLVTSL
jgi:predicted anti-sigma-YlaC factor YlaD